VECNYDFGKEGSAGREIMRGPAIAVAMSLMASVADAKIWQAIAD